MRRLISFQCDPLAGEIDQYVLVYLQELKKYGTQLSVVTSTTLAASSHESLSGLADQVFENTPSGHLGTLEKFTNGKLAAFDELLLIDDSCFGPIGSWDQVFTQSQAWDCHWWGISASAAEQESPDSSWIAIRAKAFNTSEFAELVARGQGGKTGKIVTAEATQKMLSALAQKQNWENQLLYGNEEFPGGVSNIATAQALIEANCPLLSTKIFSTNPNFTCDNAVIGGDILCAAQKRGYSVDLMWSALVKRVEPRVLATNFNLTEVISAQLPKEGEFDQLRVLVAIHCFYPQMLGELLSRASFLPCPKDVVITTDREEKAEFLRSELARREVHGQVRVVSSNRGRDISAFLLGCADLLEDPKYDLVVKLHSKKSPQDTSHASAWFRRIIFDSLLASAGHGAQILRLFEKDSTLGMVIPPIISMGYPTLGHAWFGAKEQVVAVAKRVGIEIPFDKDTPLAPYGSMFITRREALIPLLKANFRWEEFPAEGEYKDGSLAHCIERLFAYSSLSQGLQVRTVMDPTVAGISHGFLEYRLQNLGAYLPAMAVKQEEKISSYLGKHPVIGAGVMIIKPVAGRILGALNSLRAKLRR